MLSIWTFDGTVKRLLEPTILEYNVSAGRYQVYVKDGVLYTHGENRGDSGGSHWGKQTRYEYKSGKLIAAETLEYVESGTSGNSYYLNGTKISKSEFDKLRVPADSATLMLDGDSDTDFAMTYSEAISYLGSLVNAVFWDTPTNQWYCEYVDWAASAEIVTGYPDNTFRPSNTMTRAEFVQVLYNLAGKPKVAVSASFSDVSAADWYANAVSWAVSAGVTSGVGGGLFDPSGSVTREQAVMFLYKYAQMKGDSKDYSGVELTFGDTAAISAWAVPAVQWSKANGVVSGYPDGTFGPQNTATRAEVVTILYGYVN
jgi:hypothetical protein